jgi:glycosyltransferase involved in cell wall biosynthesis
MKCFPIKQSIGAISSILSTKVIAVADAAADNLIDMGVPEKRISVIINGVDGFRKYSEAERERQREQLGVSGCFVVGICARLERCKDHATFLRAARLLSRKDDRYRFIIIGDGSERERLFELCESLGLCQKVIFTGFCDDVERYYNCLDLNVNCSVGTETSSLALSEGMSIGLVSVASSFGGNPNMVRDGENGYIYEAGNFFALAERIERIANDKALYERMSSSALHLFKTEFNSRKMTDKTEGLYSELFEKVKLKGECREGSEL